MKNKYQQYLKIGKINTCYIACESDTKEKMYVNDVPRLGRYVTVTRRQTRIDSSQFQCHQATSMRFACSFRQLKPVVSCIETFDRLKNQLFNQWAV